MAQSLTPAMFVLLLALLEGERHGYALMSDTARLSQGAIVLGPGTLYRTLQRMRVDGLVLEVDADPLAVRADRRAERRRSYQITEAGRHAARAEARRLAAILSSDAAQSLLRSSPVASIRSGGQALSWITAPPARGAEAGGGACVSRAQIVESADEAVAGIEDGSTVLVGGFGLAGMPFDLVDGLIRQGARDLTVVSNNAGNGETGLAALLKAGRVRKIICSFPRQADSYVFDGLYRAGKIELEVVPQGNLAERMRAAGAGIGAFYCPTAVGTPLAEGKETREIDGRAYVLEYPIRADYAFVSAYRADTLGNLVYRKTARNFGPVMATAAGTTIVQVSEVVPVGTLDPEAVVTPSIYVDRVVRVAAR